MQVATVGLDLAKNVFQVHGVNAHGKVVLRKQLRRDQVAAFTHTLLPLGRDWYCHLLRGYCPELARKHRELLRHQSWRRIARNVFDDEVVAASVRLEAVAFGPHRAAGNDQISRVRNQDAVADPGLRLKVLAALHYLDDVPHGIPSICSGLRFL